METETRNTINYNYYARTYWIIAIAFVLRLLVIGFLGLGDDEAHYWQYAHYLSLSYFDHPPFIACMIKAFCIFGRNEFFVRFGAVLFSSISSYFLFLLAKDMFGVRVGFWSIIIFNVTPVFSFLGSVLAVPDVPLSLFWILYLYLFYKIITKQKAYLWYITGILFGLGLLSKYNAVLLPGSVFLFLLFTKEYRFWLKKKEFYISILIGFIIFIPVIVWNIENNWASFGFQLAHGFGKSKINFSFNLLGKCLGAQAGYISPILFFIFWYSVGKGLYVWLKLKDARYSFLFWMSAPTLVFFNVIASFNEILPHWPALGYMSAVILVADFMCKYYDRLKSSGKKRAAAMRNIVLGSGLILTLLIPIHALFKVIPVPEEAYDVTDELFGWKDAGNEIDSLRKAYRNDENSLPIIVTHRHYLASQMGFYVPGHPMIYCLNNKIDQYDFWQRGFSYKGRALFVTDNRFRDNPNEMYSPIIWKELDDLYIARKGKQVRTFKFYLADDFDTSKLDPSLIDGGILPKKELWEELKDFDRNIFLFFNNKLNNKIFSIYFGFCSILGYGWAAFLAGGLLLYYHDKRNAVKNIILFGVVITAGGIVVQILKGVFDRPRPLGDMAVLVEQQKIVINTMFRKLFSRSFPSGHAQTGFAAAYFLAKVIKKKQILIYTIGVSIAFSRVYIGAHFFSDIIGGAFVGYICAVLIMKLWDRVYATKYSS
ncbi:MAG: glycosyltransferase family 39 protein [Elusimicrobiota bacterium]